MPHGLNFVLLSIYMRHPIGKKSLVALSIIGLLTVIVLIQTKDPEPQQTPTKLHPYNSSYSPPEPPKLKDDNSIEIDFDGDSLKESIKVIELDDGIINMEAYDSDGNIVADLWENLVLYPTSLFEVVKLDEKSQKEYLKWDMVTGPHHIETVFLSLYAGKIRPVFSMNFKDESMYTPFYTSRDELILLDIDGDKLSEVIEFVDEYPADAPRLNNPEIEKLVADLYSKDDISEEYVKAHVEIVKRENHGLGRGRIVILGIHSFVDDKPPYFKKLEENEYPKLTDFLIKYYAKQPVKYDNETSSLVDNRIIKYSELNDDSKNFNDLVRFIWTFGRPYTLPMP